MLKPSILEKDLYLFKKDATLWDIEKVLINIGARKVDIKYGFEYSYLSKYPYLLKYLYSYIWQSLKDFSITEEEFINGNPLYFFNKYWNDSRYVGAIKYEINSILPIRTTDKYLEMNLNINSYSTYFVDSIFPIENNRISLETFLLHNLIKYVLATYKVKCLYQIDSFNLMEKEYKPGTIDVIYSLPSYHTYMLIDDIFISFCSNGYDSEYPYLISVIASTSSHSIMKVMNEYIVNKGLIVEML